MNKKDTEIKEEEKKLREMQRMVDVTAAILRQGDLNVEEALNLIEMTKKNVLRLFPDKEEAFELIYRPRLKRIIEEYIH